MKLVSSSLNGLKLFSSIRFEDNRGFFSELYHRENLKEFGIEHSFLQDNQSLSLLSGTVRGLHFQAPPFAQAKLVRCGRGALYDVAVDIRRGSPTFGYWKGFKLSALNGHQLYIPIGFAHGFVTLEENTEIVYKCSSYYEPISERSIRWDSCGVEWPIQTSPVLSEKDAIACSLDELDSPFIFGENS